MEFPPDAYHAILPDLHESAVEIDSIRTHPRNYNDGDVDRIGDSLEGLGQYRCIVVSSDGYVLRGNNTLRAARVQGWTHIAVDWFAHPHDSPEALRVLVVDNRANAMSANNLPLLVDALAELPDLAHTGWTDDEFDQLRTELEDDSPLFDEDDERDETSGGGGAREWGAPMVVGEFRGKFSEQDDYDEFVADIKTYGDEVDCIAELCARLGVEREADPDVRRPWRVQIPDSIAMPPSGEVVPIRDLNHLEWNYREGDIGLIASSLLSNTQYQAIVVQRSTMAIIAGNHTAAAARQIGWENIRAHIIDVDDETARRIAIVDNRTSDLAQARSDELLDILFDLRGSDAGLLGSGYDDDDLEDLMREVESAFAKAGSERAEIASWEFMVDGESYERWSTELRRKGGDPIGHIALMLGVDPAAVERAK